MTPAEQHQLGMNAEIAERAAKRHIIIEAVTAKKPIKLQFSKLGKKFLNSKNTYDISSKTLLYLQKRKMRDQWIVDINNIAGLNYAH